MGTLREGQFQSRDLIKEKINCKVYFQPGAGGGAPYVGMVGIHVGNSVLENPKKIPRF